VWVSVRRVVSGRFGYYIVATIAAVAFGQVLLGIGYDILKWPAVLANLVSACIVTGPAFILNRRWVWKQEGKADLVRQTAPFWFLAFVGLAISTAGVALTQHYAVRLVDNRHVDTLLIILGSCASYGVVWIARFFILDRVVFRSDRAAESTENA
jgi:putative flippase GtrA